MHKWMLGFRLYASSKKGFSTHQLMRTVNLGSYRSAWFMAHRIREAMDGADQGPPLGGEAKSLTHNRIGCIAILIRGRCS